MKKHKRSPLWFYVISGIISVAAGIGIYTAYGFHLQAVQQPQSVTVPTAPTDAPQPKTKQPPTSINIPKIKKLLPIQAALVKGNTWDLFNKAVGWVSTSAVPGEGNVILYAHDWPSLWGDLYKLKPGDAVDVYQNQTVHHYVVTESRAVNANDVGAVLSKENQLTMFTCEGTFDQKRRVVYAKPQN